MAAFAAHPNVAVKVSGLGVLGQAWTVEGNAPVVRDILRLFGDGRVMFASNFPVDSLCASFDHIFSGFKQIVSDLTPDSQERLFYGNAHRFYRTERRQQNGGSSNA
jgi:predicted TIM-barrel fold metal-dependent hydrolase